MGDRPITAAGNSHVNGASDAISWDVHSDRNMDILRLKIFDLFGVDAHQLAGPYLEEALSGELFGVPLSRLNTHKEPFTSGSLELSEVFYKHYFHGFYGNLRAIYL